MKPGVAHKQFAQKSMVCFKSNVEDSSQSYLVVIMIKVVSLLLVFLFHIICGLKAWKPENFVFSQQDFSSIDNARSPTLNMERSEELTQYEPNWDSLDKRPLPSWYDEAKFGIFIHWGVFSVPSFKSEWFWWRWKGESVKSYVDFMKKNYPPNFTYADFGRMFTAEFYDPYQWAKLFKDSGAKYVVLTSKHHEGFTNWPSKYSWNWNAKDIGPNRDLVGELAEAVRNSTDIHFGLYHSLFEWFNPLYVKDKDANFTTQSFVKAKTMPELYEIVNKYKPEVVWSDGSNGPTEYWNSTGFLAWLYNDSPVKDVVVANDRWGSDDVACHHGGVYTCHDGYNPGVLEKHKWEKGMKIDKYSWGFRRNAKIEDFETIEDILSALASTISCGGNLLLNIGPTHDGMIAPIFQERLKQMGSWLEVNGEAVYGSKPWRAQNDTVTPNIWYTAKGSFVYAFVLSWPQDNHLKLGVPVPTSAKSSITLLGSNAPVEWWAKTLLAKELHVVLPGLSEADMPCQWSWVLRFEGFR